MVSLSIKFSPCLRFYSPWWLKADLLFNWLRQKLPSIPRAENKAKQSTWTEILPHPVCMDWLSWELVAQIVKNLPAMKETQETWVQSLGREDPLEEGMATHPSILAWKISRTEEPGGLQSMGSQRIGHDWATNTLTLSLAMYNLIFPLVLNLESSLGSPQVFSEQASCPGSSVAFQITPGYLDACECPHFWREFSADFSPRHLWSISCLSCYLLFLVAVSSPLPYNNFKRCHQASAPGGLWVRWNKWNACVSPEVAARQIRTGKHSHLWRHPALLPPKPEPRAADQEYRLHVEPLCELARWWAGQGKMTQNFPCFQITFFLIQHSHGCCKTLFSGIMTVDSYSFCLFFFFLLLLLFFLEAGRVWSCPCHHF